VHYDGEVEEHQLLDFQETEVRKTLRSREGLGRWNGRLAFEGGGAAKLVLNVVP
jgi:hypothetical protein